MCLLLATFVAAALAPANSVAQASDDATIAHPEVTLKSVRKVVDTQSAGIEVECDVEVTPSIQQLDRPPRLIIEIPCTRGGVQHLTYDPPSEINSISVGMAPDQPSMSRITVDLAKPCSYAVESFGSKFLVRLKPNSSGKPDPSDSVAASTTMDKPNASMVNTAADTSGLIASSSLDAGGSITAAATTSVVRLARGGEIHVCPGTTVSLTPSRNKREWMLAMSTGTIETHYSLDASADSILTPDFRILLPGPGEFDFAVSSDTRGNTCVRALPGNTASAIVSELMGDRTYQVKPTDQIVFHAGRLEDTNSQTPPSCGCPAVLPQAAIASAKPPVDLSHPDQSAPGQPGLSTPGTAPLPPSQPNDVHVAVDVPFVFRASDMPPSVAQQSTALPPTSSSRRPDLTAQALPPVPAPADIAPLTAKTAEHRSLLGKVKGFFAKLFL
jgi:hypothetical protein